jgi:hypothetical protein
MPASSISFANRSTAATPANVVGGVVASFDHVDRLTRGLAMIIRF